MWTHKLAIVMTLSTFTAACGEVPDLNSAQDSAATSTEETNEIYVPENLVCEISTLNGYYQVVLIKQTGDCPDLDAFVVEFNNGEMRWGGPCASDATTFSHQNCQQDGRVVCGDDTMTITTETKLAQLEQTGSILTGRMTVSIEIAQEEEANCISQYQTKLERF